MAIFTLPVNQDPLFSIYIILLPLSLYANHITQLSESRLGVQDIPVIVSLHVPQAIVAYLKGEPYIRCAVVPLVVSQFLYNA